MTVTQILHVKSSFLGFLGFLGSRVVLHTSGELEMVSGSLAAAPCGQSASCLTQESGCNPPPRWLPQALAVKSLQPGSCEAEEGQGRSCWPRSLSCWAAACFGRDGGTQ